MKAQRVNPAVYAGLLAQAAWLAPNVAWGVTAEQNIDSQAFLVPFAAGLGTGIALAGSISAIAWHHSKKNLEAESIARAEREWFGTKNGEDYVPQHLCAPGEDPIVFVPQEGDADSTAAFLAALQDRPGAVPAVAAEVETAHEPEQQEAAAATQDEPDPTNPPKAPGHFASETASFSVPMTYGIPMETAGSMPQNDVQARMADLLSSSDPDETTVFLQEVSKKQEAAAKRAPRHAAQGGAHATDDYGDIATNYTERKTWSERMSQRARGVREVLSERLGKDQMDDLPVIKRADGSVGDVGTDWWERAVGKDISRDLTIPISEDYSVAQDDVDNIPFRASVISNRIGFETADLAQAQRSLKAEETIHVQQGSAMDSRPSRASISSRIPQIDEGLYPEHREVGETDKDAMWKSALEALDEKDPAPKPDAGFANVVTSDSTLDDDDVFEQPTAAIPFNRGIRQPQPIDTESYVDAILQDEMAKSASGASDAHDYLKVIDGGGQKPQDEAKPRKPKVRRIKKGGGTSKSANEA